MNSQNLSDVASGLERLFEDAPALIVLLSGPDHRVEYANASYRTLVGVGALVGRTIREVLPELNEQGFVTQLDTVFREGESLAGEGVLVRLRQGAHSVHEDRYFDYVYQPVRASDGSILGVFAQCSDTTRRVVAEASLRSSQATLELATQAAGLGVWDWYLENDHIKFSHRAREIWGLSDDEPVTQARMRELMHPADVGTVSAKFKLATDPAVRDSSAYDYRICGPGGERWIRAHAHAVFDDGPQGPAAIRYVGTMSDVTEARRTLQALKDSDDRLRLAIDAGRMAVWSVGPQGEVELTPEFNRLLNLPQDARPTLAELQARYYPGELARLQRLGEEAIASGDRYLEFEYQHLWPDDTVRWLQVRAELLRSDDGDPAGALGVVTDITERKRSEAALQALNESLEAEVASRTAERDRMWKLTTELLLIADFSATIVAVNPSWTASLGYEPHELVGQKFLDFVHSEDIEATLREVARLEEGATTFKFENRYRHKDGSYRCLNWTAVPDDAFIHAVARDVTQEREAEEALRKTEEALRQSQKMEAMGQLTGGVAHDFNNLLTPIVGTLDMLQRKSILSGEREQRLVAGAAQSAERARVLVQRLLAFARRQPLQSVAVDVTKLVHGMADLVASTTGPQIKVVVEAPDHLPAAKADQNQVEMALLNLAVNARDAMPNGGTLRIAVAAVDTFTSAAPSAVQLGRYVRISVADTGLGMDEETLARAVEPFFSTKGVGQGTGLGLSMVHGLASQLGGALTIKSKPNLGTHIDLWLPVTQSSPDESIEAQISLPTHQNGTVLLVDDENLVRLTTADMLTELGYRVVEAASAEEALRIVGADASINLILTDHLMPGMTGTDLARELGENFSHLPVLLISGYADVDGVAPDLPRLTKPFRKHELASALSNIVLSRSA